MRAKIIITFSVALAIANVVYFASLALSQRIQPPKPNPLIISGLSSRHYSSSCGFISKHPVQTITITKPNANLYFKVTGGGEPTLLIRGPKGQSFCIPADGGNGGQIEVSGLWEQGDYNLFVGNRQSGIFSFTLSINER